MTTPATRPDLNEVRHTLGLIVEPSAVVELLVPNVPKRGTVGGYYDDLDQLANDAAGLSGRAPGLYITLNRPNPALLARAHNTAIDWVKHTTSDADILHRR